MFRVLYQDDHIIAIDKPEKWLVHRSDIDKYETRFVLQHLRDQIQRQVYPVHRLDKPTSGVLVFALSSHIASLLGEQLRSHHIRKHYCALVRGFTPDQGEVDHALSIKSAFKSKQKKANEKPPQEAITRFSTVARYELPVAIDRYPVSRFSLLDVEPITGRKHQIRRHLKHLSHPIIGDPKYGKSAYNHYFSRNMAADRLLLHCRSMAFIHPVSEQPLTVEAQLTGDFKVLVDHLENYKQQ